MRFSQLATKTLMDPPKDSDSRNAELLVQAGFVRKVAAGIYSILPLGQRVLSKIEKIIEEEMDNIDGQRIFMPALTPIELWEQTGRDDVDVSFKTEGANERMFVLGWSHEEVVTPLIKEFIDSYRDLPLSVYQIQNKFRNEPRAKSGLLRGREFRMKDMYSFHTSQEDLELYYERSKEAYTNVFSRCGLKSYIVDASGGDFSDKNSHEFAVVTNAGEDTIIVYEDQDKAENIEVAEFYVKHKNSEEKEVEMAKIQIERGLSVVENAKAHSVPEWKILKTVVYKIDEGFVGISIRGDLDVSEAKMAKFFGSENIRTATDEELEKLGLVKGFISPINNEQIPFFGDKSVQTVTNFVTGANELNQDYIGANLPRDFQFKAIDYFALINEEVIEARTEGDVSIHTAVEVGNIFQLDSFYSDAFGLKYKDMDGKDKSLVMGCYGIGVTRLLGTIVEIHNDENGIKWPKTVTPYNVHLISLGDQEEVIEHSNKLYNDLKAAGFSVLYDDREERAGKKFGDADLIGISLRVVVSARMLEQAKYEVKQRNAEAAELIDQAKFMDYLTEFYSE